MQLLGYTLAFLFAVKEAVGHHRRDFENRVGKKGNGR